MNLLEETTRYVDMIYLKLSNIPNWEQFTEKTDSLSKLIKLTEERKIVICQADEKTIAILIAKITTL